MRTFAKYLAAIIGSVIAFVALSGGTAWLLVGNADNATSTAMSVISQDLAGQGCRLRAHREASERGRSSSQG